MSVPNFSFLARLEVAEKFGVVGWGWNTWLLCLTSTLVELSSVELGLGFDNNYNKLGLSCAKLSKSWSYVGAGLSFAFYTINIRLDMEK